MDNTMVVIPAPIMLIISIIIILLLGGMLYYSGLAKRKKEVTYMKNALEIVNKKQIDELTDTDKSTIQLACKMSAFRNKGVPNNYAQSIAARFWKVAQSVQTEQLTKSDVEIIQNYIVFQMYHFPYKRLNN